MKDRLGWIDFAKGLAIILVVYRHIMIGLMRAGLDVHQGYIIANEVVYTFRMPLFFILTGIFIRRSLEKRGKKFFVLNKLKTLIYPYLIWAFLQVSLQIILNNYTNSDRSWIDYLYILVHPRAIDQLWFLYALFNNCMIYLIVNKVTGNRKLLNLLIAVIFHYLATLTPQIDLLKDALYYFVFVALGDMISQYLFMEKYRSIYKSPLVFALLLALFIPGQLLWFKNPHMNTFLFALIEIVGCFLMINISFMVSSKKIFNFINIAGNYSLQIYVMHVIISSAIRIALMQVFSIQSVPILMLLGVTAGCFIPVFFYKELKMRGGWLLFTPDNPFTIKVKKQAQTA